MAELDNHVAIWWGAMSVIGIVNLLLWLLMFKRLQHEPLNRRERRQLFFCGLYVLGCASRCFVLRSDVARFAMFDSWFSTVLVGRSIATIAEISFGVQWTLLLLWLSDRTGQKGARWLAYPLVPLLIAANTCAWYGVLTTNYIGQTIEESLWTFAAALLMTGMILCLRTAEVRLRSMIKIGIIGCLGYIAFMACIDVPTYYGLWQAKEAAGATYLTLAQGVQDIQEMTITGRYEDWRYPMVWMTLYFSVAVWMSLSMVWIPFRLRHNGV